MYNIILLLYNTHDGSGKERWMNGQARREGAMVGTCDRSVSNGHEQQEQTQQDEGEN